MKSPLNWLLSITLIALTTASTLLYHRKNARPESPASGCGAHLPAPAFRSEDEELKRIEQKARELKRFMALKKIQGGLCLLADMEMPSGKKRLFIYDLRHDSLLLKGMVAHGSCSELFSSAPSFSNTEGSNCTALGHYRIGGKYQGQFGPAYKLFGLDTTNDRAYVRNIVLHSYRCVPEEETYPDPICNSLGCAMVAPGFLKQVQALIDRKPPRQPVLLWIFD